MPVFNDWQSCTLLIQAIDTALCTAQESIAASVVIVNDGSTVPVELQKDVLHKLHTIVSVQILHLVRNLGHQRAIAIGLCYAAEHIPNASALIMDSDGEDKPEDILTLLHSSQVNTGQIIFAERAKRSEGALFRFFYALYKRVYRLLTGAPISFGNFSIIPAELLQRVASVSEVWIHVASGIMKAKIPFAVVPTERGTRLAGNSTMNFVSLLLHGLSGIAVHSDVAAARLLVVSLVFIVLSVLGIIAVVLFRLFSGIAVPGWATTMIGSLVAIFMEALLMSVLLVFLVLNNRAQQPFVPRLHYMSYISSVKTLYTHGNTRNTCEEAPKHIHHDQ